MRPEFLYFIIAELPLFFDYINILRQRIEIDTKYKFFISLNVYTVDNYQLVGKSYGKIVLSWRCAERIWLQALYFMIVFQLMVNVYIVYRL